MASEERAECFGIPLVRPEAFQICRGYGRCRDSAIRRGTDLVPCGRQSIAWRVAAPLWTTTVSGAPGVWPQAVASVSERASGAST